jgi:5'-nucleotidase, C-terminal domain
VLGHSGLSRLASTRGEENAGQDLAKLDGVDALFLGHQHRLLPGEDLLVCLVSTQKAAPSTASLLSWRVFGAAISESSTFGSKWTLAGKSSSRGSRSGRSRDATQTAARSRWSNRTRRDLTFHGAPVDPNQAFLVVTNNYRASGWGGFPGCDGMSVVIEALDTNRDAVLKFIASRNEIALQSNGAWRFAPWRSTIVATYLTSPAASGLPPPPGLKLTAMGPAPGGFLKFRVETV